MSSPASSPGAAVGAPVSPLPPRARVLGVALLATLALIAVLGLLLDGPPGTARHELGVLLLDRQSTLLRFPFTVQTVMLLVFGLGLGELFLRWRVARREAHFLTLGLLPEDDETVLQAHDLGPVRRRVAGMFDDEHGFLPGLMDLCILQFQAGRSVDQAVGVLNSHLDLLSHRIDLRYSMLRYVAWVIPTLGFIGTVVGIAHALTLVRTDDLDFDTITQALAVSFNTTIVALVLSAILMLLLHVVQQREERSLNHAGSYTLRNLINRLYAGPA